MKAYARDDLFCDSESSPPLVVCIYPRRDSTDSFILTWNNRLDPFYGLDPETRVFSWAAAASDLWL